MKAERKRMAALLQRMLDHEELFNVGLCMWAASMETAGYFTAREEFDVRDYIGRNRPTERWTYDALFYQNGPDSVYYWKTFELGPRKRWLKKHIKSLLKD
jgi:hypothetical protein